MFNFFKKNQEESPLSKLLKSFCDIKDGTTIDLIVRNIIEDKINPSLFEINLCYLWNKELRPINIMKRAQLVASLEGNTFKKEHKQQMFDIASNVNKTTEKIACNITLEKNRWFFPKIANDLADNNKLNRLFWFFAAYPDVFDCFFPLPDVLSKEWEADSLTYMHTVFDEVVAKEGAITNQKLKEYINNDPLFPGYENINLFLLYLKNYYMTNLKKTLEMVEGNQQ